ncbi:aldehyde dehydrogenase family protein [Sphingobium sufflavum]|nr:aldehyde dehydrogenase family protein [Sphingobium sufflavum]MCE7795565.1 aldehyde dehydrogenase family protein [Sphingobium sufflavum]
MAETYQLFIGGQWRDSGNGHTMPAINPFNQQTWAHIPVATPADVADGNADRMALLETTDNGKVIREARTQMGYAARVYRFFAGYADKIWGNVIP